MGDSLQQGPQLANWQVGKWGSMFILKKTGAGELGDWFPFTVGRKEWGLGRFAA